MGASLALYRRESHPAIDDYARAIDAGQIVVGPYVRQAVARHYADLEAADDRGWRFDPEAAERVISFTTLLRLPKQKNPKAPLELIPWHGFCLAALFGWYSQASSGEWQRRFHRAYIEVARKNAKTALGAIALLYGTAFDGEDAAEVYSAATKREQARIAWQMCKSIANRSPGLRRVFQHYADRLLSPLNEGVLRPLSSDYERLDGSSPHIFLTDEYHAHKTDGVLMVLESGTGNRPNWLELVITTAGVGGKQTPCERLKNHCLDVLSGTVDDDEQFAFVAERGPEQDWRDPRWFQVTNPSLGVTIQADRLAKRVALAIQRPDLEPGIRQKELNEWVGTARGVISSERWNACPRFDPAELEGKPCVAGLDLSTRQDLCALVLVFEGWRVLSYFFAPEEKAEWRQTRERVPYQTWAEQGLVRLAGERIVDYEAIRKLLTGKGDWPSSERPLAERYQIRELAYDPYNAGHFVQELSGDGLACIECRQTFRNLNEATKLLLDLASESRLAHGHSEVLTWQAGNLGLKDDDAGNVMPSKKRSADKIDGISALVAALWRWQLQEPERPKPSGKIYWVGG